eukprot:CAMPEP_0172156250 /NCGR_PEP_ID=MMETSP1050-20130122/3087_1 /TAXON_ID=233186 /ORGANISM="Cryptomonas curvata, Strain CCAP979/52" /LENGTH=320 /DNA_ID=CAMNT_0012825259 /DNA_START=79 /DNA_END=1037 /DNA_ORIENTATION=-
MHVPQMHGYSLPGQYLQAGQYGPPGIPPMPTPFPARSVQPPSQNQSTNTANNSVSKQLDTLVANTKWLQCTTLIDSWISRATQVMENGQQLEPYVPFESTISESGTDLSHAQTAPFEEATSTICSESIETPASPPWRNASEGGELAIPPMHSATSDSASTVQGKKNSSRVIANSSKYSQDTLAVSSLHDLSLTNTKKPSGAQSGPSDRSDDTRHSRGNGDLAARKSHSQAATADSAEGKHEAKHEASSKQEAKQVALGIILGKSGEEEGMTIMRIKDGGIAALHGGLTVGMRILTIDGMALDGLSPLEMNRLTTGPEGST